MISDQRLLPQTEYQSNPSRNRNMHYFRTHPSKHLIVIRKKDQVQ